MQFILSSFFSRFSAIWSSRCCRPYSVKAKLRSSCSTCAHEPLEGAECEKFEIHFGNTRSSDGRHAVLRNQRGKSRILWKSQPANGGFEPSNGTLSRCQGSVSERQCPWPTVSSASAPHTYCSFMSENFFHLGPHSQFRRSKPILCEGQFYSFGH